MKTLARPALRSAATSISTMAGVRIRALTERHPIKPTSPRCHSAWQLNLGRHSTYRRGKSVQTTGTTSVDSAFAGLTPDGAVLAFDRRQRGTFRKSFEEYASTRVIPARIKRAKQLMQRHAALLARIERQFGVPARLLMAIWTLESDNGSGDMGKLPVIRTLASLAHDCRRSELFQGELLAALQIVQRGDLLLRDLIGAYAGEIGQTQFLPSSYIKYGVDYDGNGHVDLRHSVPDVLASTANLLKTNGWRAGAPFGEGTANFDVMSEWNRSVVYRKAMVLFAERLAEP